MIASLFVGFLITVGASLVYYEFHMISNNTGDGKYTLDEFINFSQYVDFSIYSLAEFISFKLMIIVSMATYGLLTIYKKYLENRTSKAKCCIYDTDMLFY